MQSLDHVLDVNVELGGVFGDQHRLVQLHGLHSVLLHTNFFQHPLFFVV
jgi:hypothetical protein